MTLLNASISWYATFVQVIHVVQCTQLTPVQRGEVGLAQNAAHVIIAPSETQVNRWSMVSTFNKQFLSNKK